MKSINVLPFFIDKVKRRQACAKKKVVKEYLRRYMFLIEKTVKIKDEVRKELKIDGLPISCQKKTELFLDCLTL